ncbi:MAG: SLC13 family permease, partial [Flavobacteriaceae bacterium]
TRTYILQPIFPAIDDTIIAMISGITLFLLPAKESEKKILHWNEAVKMSWGIILLFGGGMAIAKGFEVSGLAVWIGSQISFIEQLNLFLMILVLVAFVNFLTEITSNLATTAMLLPILTSIALQLGVHPYSLLVSAAIAASCAFMLPVATPPNAVVFGSGYLKIKDMTRNGLFLNIFSIFLIVIMIYYMLPLLWNYKPTAYPEIFKN